MENKIIRFVVCCNLCGITFVSLGLGLLEMLGQPTDNGCRSLCKHTGRKTASF